MTDGGHQRGERERERNAGEDVAGREGEGGRTPPGNILISKIFAFVFKKRERSGGQGTLHPSSSSSSSRSLPESRRRDKKGKREGGREGEAKEGSEGILARWYTLPLCSSRDADGRWGMAIYRSSRG